MAYFIDTVLVCTEEKNGEYLAIYNGGKLRYLINIKKGNAFFAKQKLCANIAAYSSKLSLLIKFLKWIPTKLLVKTGIAKRVSIKIDSEVSRALEEISREKYGKRKIYFNVIVGSYVEKQKIVLQCFCPEQKETTVYLKVGDERTDAELVAETTYLSNPIKTKAFKSPELCFSSARSFGNQYNIQGTKEFVGETVSPTINEDIVAMYQAICQSCAKKINAEGKEVYFSHGDFVPWNIRKNEEGYILFDWEYCGFRFYGFDLIHFAWQVENKLNKKGVQQAFYDAIVECKKWDDKLRNYEDSELEKMYLEELHKQFGDVL